VRTQANRNPALIPGTRQALPAARHLTPFCWSASTTHGAARAPPPPTRRCGIARKPACHNDLPTFFEGRARAGTLAAISGPSATPTRCSSP